MFDGSPSRYNNATSQQQTIVLSHVQSTLVISKSKGPSKTRRDIRTSTYQISSIKEKRQFE